MRWYEKFNSDEGVRKGVARLGFFLSFCQSGSAVELRVACASVVAYVRAHQG